MLLSKKSFYIIFLLIKLIIVYRLLLPFSDEPDFLVRVDKILYNKNLYSHYYFFKDYILEWGIYNNFEYEEFFHKVLRILITIFALTPILLVVLFKNIAINNLLYYSKEKYYSFVVSLFLPGMIYYLGVFGEEQFTLILSLLVFIFFNSILMLILLLSYITIIDFGNGLVVFLFVILFKSILYLSTKLSIKIVLILLLIMVFLSYIFGLELILIFNIFPIISDYSSVIYNDYSNEHSYVYEKYPIILRPIITFMTFIFMTPNKVGVYILYGISFLFILIIIIKMFKNINTISKQKIVYFITPIFFILSCVFVLPGFSNAKYYIFTFPFILYGMQYFYNIKNIFIFLLFLNLVVILMLTINVINI